MKSTAPDKSHRNVKIPWYANFGFWLVGLWATKNNLRVVNESTLSQLERDEARLVAQEIVDACRWMNRHELVKEICNRVEWLKDPWK